MRLFQFVLSLKQLYVRTVWRLWHRRDRPLEIFIFHSISRLAVLASFPLSLHLAFSFLQSFYSSVYSAVVHSLLSILDITWKEPFITGPRSVIHKAHLFLSFLSAYTGRERTRKNYSKNSPNARTERSVAVKYSEKCRERKRWTRDPETSICQLHSSFSFPHAIEIFAFHLPLPLFSVPGLGLRRDAFKPPSKSNYFALTERYPLKLDVIGDLTSDRHLWYTKVLSSTTTASH